MGILNGEAYYSKSDRPFRHLVYLRKYDARGSVLDLRLCWIHSRKIWDNASDLMRCPAYVSLRDRFIVFCRNNNIPIHNSIAFWEHLFLNGDDLAPWERFCLIMCATCNLGDFFQYAVIRSTPRNFAWPNDLDALRDPPSEEWIQICREQILRELQNTPELVEGTEKFNEFSDAWNHYLYMEQQYQDWAASYSKLKIDWVKPSHQATELKPLINIFRQYIYMLSQCKNSNTHPDFEESYKQFLNGQDNELLYSFQQITALLKTHAELAKIAPIYVLSIFQKDAKSLYDDWTQMSASKARINLNSFSRKKVKLYKDTTSNIRYPRDVQLITYQLLCKFFDDGTLIGTAYDQALCDHILPSCIPLIGQQYFTKALDHYEEIITSGCYNFSNKELSARGKWTHPLLEKIERRLVSSLNLHPEDIPVLSITTRRSLYEKDFIDDAQKLVGNSFVEEYMKVFLEPANGLGCPRILEDIQEPLANLFDRTIQKSAHLITQHQINSWGSVEPEILLAYEKGFHATSTQRIFNDFYTKVLIFLYQYFRSADFCCGKLLPHSEKLYAATEDGTDIWDAWRNSNVSDFVPSCPIYDSPQKLNIDNLDGPRHGTAKGGQA